MSKLERAKVQTPSELAHAIDPKVDSLLEKCLSTIDEARSCKVRERFSHQSQAIAKAINILAYLQSCLRLDTKEAERAYHLLSAAYINAEHMLIKANVTHDSGYLNNAHSLISEIKSEWSHAKNERV